MKIAFVSYEYPPYYHGGAGTYAENIVRELARQNHEVHVITHRLPQCPDDEIKDGVFIHRLNFIDIPLMRAPSFWYNVRNKYKDIVSKAGVFDIIHGNTTSDFLLSKPVTGKIPRVITVHHLANEVVSALKPSLFERIKNLGGETGLTPLIEKAYIKQAEHIITDSQHTREKLVSTYRVEDKNISVIPLGREQKPTSISAQEKEQIKSKFKIGKEPVLLFVGRVDDKRKGLDVLLKALKIVLIKTVVTLVVAGSGKPLVYKGLLSSDVADRVIFTGFVDDNTLAKLYSACDIYVCPSRLEGFGLTLLDAMAAGKPVIATATGSIPEIIENGQNGLLVRPGAEKELAQAILQLLNDKAQAQAIGENNKIKMQSYPNWETVAKKTVEVYLKLV